MKKWLMRHAVLLFFVALSAGGLMHVSYMVQQAEERKDYLEHKINKERSTIEVLEAEWAYLNSPQRLEAVSNQYLELGPPESSRMVDDIQNLPGISPELMNSSVYSGFQPVDYEEGD